MDILEGKTPNVVAFWSVKGGVGRTTLAAAVGIKRALEGKKVLLIDMDLEAPSLDLVTFSEMPPDNDVLTVDGLLLELQEFENEFRVSETDKIEKVMKELEGKEEKLKWKFNEALFKEYSNLFGNYREKVKETIDGLKEKLSENLLILPCRRKLENLLKIDYMEVPNLYDPNSYEKSFVERCGSLIKGSMRALQVDDVIIDCRSGISDAAAGILRHVETVALTSDANYISIEAIPLSIDWLKEKYWTHRLLIVANKVAEYNIRKKVLGKSISAKIDYKSSPIIFIRFYKQLFLTGLLFSVWNEKEFKEDIDSLYNCIFGGGK